MNTISTLLMIMVALQSEGPRGILGDPKLPSVYLRYDREEQNRIWLRLHNNTTGAISLCTESSYITGTVPLTLANRTSVLALRDGREANVCYTVEAPETAIATSRSRVDFGWNPYHSLPLAYHGDVMATSWIGPGSSILISLPREHLSGQNRIRISFNYEWEAAATGMITHTVYFYGSDTPRNR
jgi:hypothetical protein